MSGFVRFRGAEAVRDLRTLLQRLQVAGCDAVWLLGRPGVVAFGGAVLAPASLLDSVPTVLVFKGFEAGFVVGESSVFSVLAGAENSDFTGLEKAESAESSGSEEIPESASFAALETPEFGGLNSVFELRAITDRLAFLAGTENCDLVLPPQPTSVVWAGITPPLSGWQVRGQISADSLREVARQGAAQVAQILPENPGELLLQKVRAEVWGQEMLPGVPAAAGFGLETAGFLAGNDAVRISQAPGWLRLESPAGSVLVR
ncbi:MAG: hypothetical protein Q4C71_03040 [Microbacteriaceae bacterium]|nr:hypothetical protein [Microbacteriaceae bacterium]